MKKPNSLIIYIVALWWTLAPLAALRAIPLAAFLGGSPPSTPAATYLVKQNFETATTGYDNSESWLTSVGTPNPAYTGVVLLGSQSLLANTATTAVRVRTDFTGADTLWGYFLFRRVGSNPGGDRILFELTVNGGTTRALAILVTSGGNLKVDALSSGTATTATATTTGTTYHVWWKYIKGTASNSVGEVGFSTDGTKPTSGGTFASFSSGNTTSQGGRIYLGYTSTNAAADFIYDKVLVDDEAIGSNP